MTPQEFASIVVMPTVREFLDARGDLRRAILACIAVYHLPEYMAAAAIPDQASKRAIKAARETEVDAIRGGINAVCAPSLAVVRGICNGSKHANAVRPTTVPVFALDVPGAGWDQGRFDVPGLEVDHEGQRLFIDWCLQMVVLTVLDQHHGLLDPLDVSFFDTAFRGTAGWPEGQ